MKYDEFIDSTKYQREYDEVVSLGFNCHTATALERLNLRKNSYPLDWGRVVEEDTKDELGFCRKIEFLCTEFKDFINESDLYVAYDNYEHEPDPHMGVFNKFNGMHFIHDFPKGKTIAESYPEVKAKYDRRIKRLMNLINSDKKICFVFYAGLQKLSDAEILYSTEIFYKIFPKANVDFLILQNNLEVGDNVIYEELSEHVRRVCFYNGPYEDAFQSDIDSIIGKIQNVIHTCITKKYFLSSELKSNYHDGDVITNPTHDYNGIISFGPYVPLNSGDHTVTVDYELTDNYNGFVDVACDKGKTIVQKIELPHNQKQFKFDFKLDKNVVDLEVRFYGVPKDKTDSTNKFKLYGIEIN